MSVYARLGKSVRDSYKWGIHKYEHNHYTDSRTVTEWPGTGRAAKVR
jgi:hypothetical protein